MNGFAGRVGTTLATSVRLPATAFVAATTLLALLELAMVDAGAFSIAQIREQAVPDGVIGMGIGFSRFAHSALFVLQLLACCLLAWWTIRLARAIAEHVTLSREPEWYGNVWCIPITNLWRPFEGLRELWVRTGRWTRRSGRLLRAAWVTWVAHQLLCILGALPLMPETRAEMLWLIVLWMLRDAVFVVGALLGIAVVVWLTAVHTRTSAPLPQP